MRRYIYWRLKMREPFGLLIGTVPNIHAKHPRACNKTIMVENNDVDSAFHLLNRLMSTEGIMRILVDTQRYIPPTQQRRKISQKAINCIVEEEMDRKMRFLMRKNREDPFPGQITT